MTSALGEYAVIGDGRTCALVAPTGSIDFFCCPKFDSDACFAALLGDERRSHWRIAPAGYVASTSRQYREDTAILETEHVADVGKVRVVDFMPWHDGASALIRIVEGLEGRVPMALSLRLRFGFGQVSPWVQPHKRGLIAEIGCDRVILDSPLDLAIERDMATASFSVEKGDRVCSINWVGRFNAPCRWPNAVKRSLLILRTLTDRKSGGIVAAATLGLPEIPGGSMNWDYRYCWLRDSTFTLTALLNAGLHEEAMRWRDWVVRAVGGEPSKMQIV